MLSEFIEVSDSCPVLLIMVLAFLGVEQREGSSLKVAFIEGVGEIVNFILSSSVRTFRHIAILLTKEVSDVDALILILESAAFSFLSMLLDPCVQLGSKSAIQGSFAAILGSQSVAHNRLQGCKLPA